MIFGFGSLSLISAPIIICYIYSVSIIEVYNSFSVLLLCTKNVSVLLIDVFQFRSVHLQNHFLKILLMFIQIQMINRFLIISDFLIRCNYFTDSQSEGQPLINNSNTECSGEYVVHL